MKQYKELWKRLYKSRNLKDRGFIYTGVYRPEFVLSITQNPDICMTVVKEDGLALRYVEDQTPEICMAAVHQKGEALQFVENQTPEICIAAVQQ